MHDIFVNLNFRRLFLVMRLLKRGRRFVLTCGRYFVVVRFSGRAHLLYDGTFQTDILRGVNWRNRGK